MAKGTRTGGREATTAVIPGKFALSVGRPKIPEPRGFRWRTLSDLARLESGHTPSREVSDYWSGDIPWIGIRDASANHGRTIYDTEQHVTQEGIDNSSARVLPAGTVCLSRTASVGFVVTMGVPMATSQDFVNWVCGPELDARYLQYVLMAEQDSVRRFAYGSVHPTLYYPDAKALHVCIPDFSRQRAIADVLNSIDDKIAVNQRLTDTAATLSRVLFASMPVEEERIALSSVAQFVNGKAFTKGASGTGRVVVRIAELNSGLTGSTVYSDAIVPDQHVAQPGDILFAWSGSLTLHRWYRPDAIVNQHIFKVIPNEGRPPWLVWQLIAAKLDEFKAIAANKATTMGHIQRRHLDEPVAVPTREAIEHFDAQMAALWERALAAEQENLTLAATRDALLPALMSGRLRVRDAARTVEAIV